MGLFDSRETLRHEERSVDVRVSGRDSESLASEARPYPWSERSRTALRLSAELGLFLDSMLALMSIHGPLSELQGFVLAIIFLALVFLAWAKLDSYRDTPAYHFYWSLPWVFFVAFWIFAAPYGVDARFPLVIVGMLVGAVVLRCAWHAAIRAMLGFLGRAFMSAFDSSKKSFRRGKTSKDNSWIR